MRKGNILLIILIVVGIMTASIGGYFWWQSSFKVSTNKQNQTIPDLKPKEATPSASKTVNRDVFVANKATSIVVNKLTFEIPQGWQYRDISVLQNEGFSICPPGVPEWKGPFDISFIRGPFDLGDYMANQTEKKISIDGREGTLFSGDGFHQCIRNRVNVLYIPIDKGSYVFFDCGNIENHQIYFDQIFSTFKFL